MRQPGSADAGNVSPPPDGGRAAATGRAKLAIAPRDDGRSDDIQLDHRPVLGEDVLIFRRGASVLFYCGSTGEGRLFNETAALILSAADGSTTVAQIAEALCARFDVDRQTALRDVRSVIRLAGRLQLLGISF